MPDHTRGAHPTASGRLKTVVLFRQSYPALTNGGVVNAVVPCGTGALVTQTTLRTLRQLSYHLGSRLPLRVLSGLECRALDVEERGPSSSFECGTTPAGALDHEELFGIEREKRPVPQIADSSAPSAGKCNFSTFASSSFEELFGIELRIVLVGPNKSSCACTWSEGNDISKDRWPVSQPKFSRTAPASGP